MGYAEKSVDQRSKSFSRSIDLCHLIHGLRIPHIEAKSEVG